MKSMLGRRSNDHPGGCPQVDIMVTPSPFYAILGQHQPSGMDRMGMLLLPPQQVYSMLVL